MQIQATGISASPSSSQDSSAACIASEIHWQLNGKHGVPIEQGIKSMRLAIAMLAACLVSGTTWAQTKKLPEKVWTAAPVPGDLPSNVAPADRAGSNTGSDASSPFSSVPPGARVDSRPNDITRDGGGPGTDSVTPNLSR